MPSGVYKRIKVAPETRFFKSIKKTNNCWIWVGYKERKGYGKFWSVVGTLAHRFSYFYHKGQIPKGMLVCHTCDNPSCVNPKHLWIGTAKDNQRDCMLKGRDRRVIVRGEQNGLSKLNEKQVRKIKQLKEKYKQPQLAQMFNCHQTTIHYILSGKTWKHVK